MASVPGNRTVNTSSELAAIDAPIGTEIWVIDDQQNWKAVPREPASGGIAGPSASLRMWWAPADVADGRFGPFASIAAFRAATPPSVDTECSIEGVGRGIYKPGSGANTIDDGMYVIKPTSVATASNGRFFLRQSITPSLPRYVYGLEAGSLLASLASSKGKSMFCWGDSRTVGLTTYAPSTWTNSPIGGRDIIGMTLVGAGETHVTMATDPATVWPTDLNSSAVRKLVLTVTAAATSSRTELNHTWNRLTTIVLSPYGVDGVDTVFNFPFTLQSTGVEDGSIAVQVWVNSDYSDAPNWARSVFFGTVGTNGTVVVKQVRIPAAATTWGAGGAVEIVRRAAALVQNQTIKFSDPWVDRNDGTGIVLFNGLNVSGMHAGQILDDAIFIPAALTDYFRPRATKEPWMLLDIGTNGFLDSSSPGYAMYSNTEWHCHSLRRIIAKFRTAVGDWNAKVLLRTSFPNSTDGATSYYQLAAIRVAQEDRGVICVDTYGAAVDGGGYAAAVTKAFMADTVHRNTAGRYAQERMYNAIIGGGVWDYSATLG